MNRLSRKYTFSSLLIFSLPTIVMMVFMSLYTMADGVFVSRLIGTDALSAVNIVFPLVSVIIAVAVMLATGASAIVARKMGEDRPEEARQDFTFIMVVGVVFGLAITVAGIASLDPLLRFLGANSAVYALCRAYAYPLLWFTVPAILQMFFQTFFVTAGRPGIGLAVTALGGLANIALDYVFIARFGWGMQGAALATGIGYSIPALYGLYWFSVRKNDLLRFARPVWRGAVLLKTLTNGASEMVINLSTAIVTYLFNITMMRFLGQDGVAAVTIVLYAEYLLVAIYLGYSTGIAPILSFNHGERNYVQLRRLFHISMAFLAVASAVTFLGALALARSIVGVFAPVGTAVFPLAVHGFTLFAAGFLFKGVNIFASSMFTALSDGKTSALLSFLRSLVFIVLGMLLLPRLLGVDGVWLAVPFAELLSVAVSLFCFRRHHRREWREEQIEICPVTGRNKADVLALRLAPGQEKLIESPGECLSEAEEDARWKPVAVYVGRKVVGFAMYGRFGKPDGRVWLDRLLIDSRYQNQGYGSRVVQAMIDRLQDEYRCDRIYLSVYRENERARRLYEKYGFRRSGELDTKGEEIMSLQL